MTRSRAHHLAWLVALLLVLVGLSSSGAEEPAAPEMSPPALRFDTEDLPEIGQFLETFGADNFSSSTSVVPVPAAVWLFGSALLGFAGVAKRKHA